MNDEILRDDGMEDANVNVDDNIQNEHANIPSSDEKVKIPTMKVIPLKKICMTIGQLPTAYIETMSYYEMLVWFIEFLRNNIIPTVNNNGEAVQELQTIVMTLQNYINTYKQTIDEEMNNFQEAVNNDILELEDYMNNYFNNLDVQEEINNKLDQMLEDGVLEQIIEQFLQSTAVWCFDNVADMKLATNLTNGSYAKTLGFYSANDGGGATYKITNTKSQTEYQEEINNNLYATLICYSKINVLSLGLKNDGLTNNSDIFDNIKNLNKKYTFIFPSGTYLFNETIEMNDYCYFELDNNAELKLNDNSENFIYIKYITDEVRTNYIKGGIINGNFKCNNLISIDGIYSMDISPCVMKNFNQKGFNGQYNNNIRRSSNIKLHDTYMMNDSPITNTYGIYDNTYDNTFYNIVIRDIETGIFTNSSSFINIHHWLNSSSLIENSLFAYLNSRVSRFTNCTIDTIRNGFDGANWSSCNIANLQLLYNTNIYTSEYQTNYPPCIFNNNGNKYYNVSGVNIQKLEFDIYFANNQTFSRYTIMDNIVLRKETGNETIYNYYNKDNNLKKFLNASSNFDDITEQGDYVLNTYNGTGGTNVPANLTGIMMVINTYGIPNQEQVILQIIFSGTKITSRKKSGSNAWTSWTSVTLS